MVKSALKILYILHISLGYWHKYYKTNFLVEEDSHKHSRGEMALCLQNWAAVQLMKQGGCQEGGTGGSDLDGLELIPPSGS